jgi:RNA polymerase sigma-70 factor (ECF subfamily)
VIALTYDNELHSLLLTEPEKGLIEIMDRYTPFVYTIVHGKLSLTCKNDIEECVSDVFYELYKTRNSINLEKGSLKAYIAVLAKRKAIGVFRKSGKWAGEVYIDGAEGEWIADSADVEQGVIDCETRRELLRNVKSLGEPDSSIIIRKYYYGQSSKVISKALGLKVNTVDKKVSRALVKLREALGGML